MMTTACFHGGLTNTHGLCPGCGREVPRTHAWNSAGARDAYECHACGTFEYANDNVEMPTRSPVTLGSVLDPGDCIA